MTGKFVQSQANDQCTRQLLADANLENYYRICRIDEEIHPEDEPQSLAGKGLRIYAQCVRRRVEARGSTSYNEVSVHFVVGH